MVEAVILVGGLGTRLKSMTNGLPKPMIDVNGKPFLSYILNFLCSNGFRKIILAVGYRHNVIESYFKYSYKNMEISYSVEEKSLGTGGAILKTLDLIESDYFFVLNGDTFFNINFNKMEKSI
jgi:D-glycero-alpha-D-manno-heptose 1-phosphate guanylyltransferase